METIMTTYYSKNLGNLPTLERVKELLDYDSYTGEFKWKVCLSNSAPVGAIAGAIGGNGYRVIRINKANILAHRLAWFMVHGEWPNGNIDHVNGKRSDNRLINLREATVSQNAMNTTVRAANKSGVPGVSWDKSKNGWVASITVNGKQIKRRFKDFDAAVQCRLSLIKEHFGDFANPGSLALSTGPADSARTIGQTLAQEER